MKEKVNQMFKDKLFLVMFVLGLLTMVAAAGVFSIQRGNPEESAPYLELTPEQLLAGEQAAEPVQIAGPSDAEEEAAPAGNRAPESVLTKETEPETQAAAVGTAKEAARPLALNFTETSSMVWPVRGNVLLDYSMDHTIYFPTLDQYQCSPGIVIQSEVSTPAAAPANARVLEVGTNEEIGGYVVLDLGNQYTATCGQLKEIPVVQGEYLEAGQTLGYVAEPTKYYAVEGVNLYFQVDHQGQAVDPLDFVK